MTPAGQPRLTDRIRIWWLNRLDNDSVRPLVPFYCTIWLSWALLATFWLPPVPTIEPVMGPGAYTAWLWLAIMGNIAPIAGLWMRHGGSAVQQMSSRLLLRDWMGLIFQVTGHAVCLILLLMFQVSAWIAIWTYNGPSAYAGMTVFCASMLLAWTGGVGLLCAQCCRKIQRGMELERTEAERREIGLL